MHAYTPIPRDTRRAVCLFTSLTRVQLCAMSVEFHCAHVGMEARLDRCYMILQLERVRVHSCEARKNDLRIARGLITGSSQGTERLGRRMGLMAGYDGIGILQHQNVGPDSSIEMAAPVCHETGVC